MKSKKVLAIVLVAAIVLSMGILAACGKKTPANEEKTAAVKVVDIKLTDENYAFGVDKAQPELLAKVNAFVAEIQTNGKLDEICNKYFAGGTPTPIVSATLDSTKDQLVVATNAAFEPFEYKDGENYLGIDMEIAKALADYLGKELVIQNMEFDAVCLSVGQHKCDIAMAGLTVKEERKEYVEFSTSYYKASQKLIVKGDDKTFDACTDAASVEAILNGLDKTTVIGVQTGTTGQFYVQGDADWGFNGFPVTCTGYKNGSLAVQDLINGGVKYVVIDEAPAACIAKAINEMN